MVTSVEPRRRILLVEDDELSARAMTRFLEQYEISVAATVTNAIDLALRIRPDLMIVDFYLSDGTGREVIDRVREAEIDAPILLMSAKLPEEEWEEWVAYLADDFLVKPFRGDQLAKKVRRLISAYELQRQTARQHAELMALHEATARETEAARRLLDRMLQRGQFDPNRAIVDAKTVGTFGGDVVFGWELGKRRYRWLVGDATGHTLASTFVTIPVSMLFYNTAFRDVDLEEVTFKMDTELHAMLPIGMFFAMTLCELDRELGTLHVINAGGPDVLVRRCSGQFDAIASSQPPLGIAPSEPSVTRIRVGPGDRIYAFTDGLLELRNRHGEMFGLDGVRAALSTAHSEAAFARLRAAWREHAANAELEDDLSVIEVLV